MSVFGQFINLLLSGLLPLIVEFVIGLFTGGSTTP